ncbi:MULTISPECIES: glycosyltransferase family 32 protein [unclassified Acinetobacter]|uniref:glycosyltransferase family 32 protein n=1 Tax=unclassified Acinetobacter TaxID=196816 RepID=UPI0015D2C989|nr:MULTISPECIES: glycosyltransferase [unclassified Acinetobacter]UUS60882.1 polysaccharide biosynthesis protein [Acinetobacter sp. YH16056_T]
MIPKKIHFCWFGPNEYSPLVEKCMRSWSDKLKDWEFILWNEKNSPMDHPFVKKALREKRYAFVADYVRFYALYNFGGIYLDTDMEIIKDLTPLLDNDFFVGSETSKKICMSAGIIGSVENNPFLFDVLKYYDTLNYYRTSPNIMDYIFSLKDYKGINIYNYKYFYPYNPYDEDKKVKQLFFSDISSETFAIHHWNFSWKLNFFQKVLDFIKKKFKLS